MFCKNMKGIHKIIYEMVRHKTTGKHGNADHAFVYAFETVVHFLHPVLAEVGQ